MLAMLRVPLVVIGPPVSPVPEPTLVTVPVPVGVAQVPSPRQNVEDDAPVPPFKTPTGRLVLFIMLLLASKTAAEETGFPETRLGAFKPPPSVMLVVGAAVLLCRTSGTTPLIASDIE